MQCTAARLGGVVAGGRHCSHLEATTNAQSAAGLERCEASRVLSAAASLLAFWFGPDWRGAKLLEEVVAAKVEIRSVAFGMESGLGVHGHAADRVPRRGCRVIHGQRPFVRLWWLLASHAGPRRHPRARPASPCSTQFSCPRRSTRQVRESERARTPRERSRLRPGAAGSRRHDAPSSPRSRRTVSPGGGRAGACNQPLGASGIAAPEIGCGPERGLHCLARSLRRAAQE